VLEKITHNARGEIVDLYSTWQWPTLCEAVEDYRRPMRLEHSLVHLTRRARFTPRMTGQK